MAERVTYRASTNDIVDAARRHGRTRTEAGVLGIILFWSQGQKGGLHIEGDHWTYRSAPELAAELHLSVRTVERALRSLYGDGVLAHMVITRPGHEQLRVTACRPLDPALDILRMAVATADGRLNVVKRRGGRTVNKSACTAPGRRDQSRQNDGFNQEDIQEHLQENVPITSPHPVGCGDHHFLEELEEIQEGDIEVVVETEGMGVDSWKKVPKLSDAERVMVFEQVEIINAGFACQASPPIQIVSDMDAKAILNFSAEVTANGRALSDTARRIAYAWPVIVPCLPEKFSDFEGNKTRPNALALGWAAVPILGYLGAFEVGLQLHRSVGHLDQPSADISEIKLHKPVRALIKAARKFASDYLGYPEPNSYLRTSRYLRHYLLGTSLGAPLEEGHHGTELIATAGAYPEFLDGIGDMITGLVTECDELGVSFSECELIWRSYIEALTWAGVPKGVVPPLLQSVDKVPM